MENREAAENREAFDKNEAFNKDEASSKSEIGGVFDDMATLVVLIGASARDTARLMGLETRLVIKTIVTMVVVGVVLGLVILGVWLSITFMVTAGLYEYAGLSLTLSIIAASVINVTCAVALVLLLKRMAQKLAFPETRLAVNTLMSGASSTMQKQE